MTAPITLDLAGIRARAVAASEGCWVSDSMSFRAEGDPAPMATISWYRGISQARADAAHIAGMDPPTTLALVDEAERQAGELSRAISSIAVMTSRAVAAEAEAAKLRARVAELEGK